MAQYMILIYESEAAYAAGGDAAWAQSMKDHQEFTAGVEKLGGKILGGEALQPLATATSIRENGTQVTDGPFAETKEAFGGFYLVEAADLDVAIAIAKTCPHRFGGVEVRPVIDFEAMQA